jgi:hypothetical protein
VFDGRSLNSDTAAFQLCDIVDPMLKDMVDDDDDLREVCHVSEPNAEKCYTLTIRKDKDGWYKTEPFEQIKIILRHKFYSLLDGYVATDEECNALLIPSAATGKVPVAPHSRKARHHKHNMAKGALPMEDAAVKLGHMGIFAKAYSCTGPEVTFANREECFKCSKCAGGFNILMNITLVIGLHSKMMYGDRSNA